MRIWYAQDFCSALLERFQYFLLFSSISFSLPPYLFLKRIETKMFIRYIVNISFLFNHELYHEYYSIPFFILFEFFSFRGFKMELEKLFCSHRLFIIIVQKMGMGNVVGVIESIDLILLWQWHFHPVHWCLYLTSMETKGSDHGLPFEQVLFCCEKCCRYPFFQFCFMCCELKQTFVNTHTHPGWVNAPFF